MADLIVRPRIEGAGLPQDDLVLRARIAGPGLGSGAADHRSLVDDRRVAAAFGRHVERIAATPRLVERRTLMVVEYARRAAAAASPHAEMRSDVQRAEVVEARQGTLSPAIVPHVQLNDVYCTVVGDYARRASRFRHRHVAHARRHRKTAAGFDKQVSALKHEIGKSRRHGVDDERRCKKEGACDGRRIVGARQRPAPGRRVRPIVRPGALRRVALVGGGGDGHAHHRGDHWNHGGKDQLLHDTVSPLLK